MKKGPWVSHMIACNVVPPMLALKLDENIPQKAAGNAPKSNLPGNPLVNDNNRLNKHFDNLDISGIELWTEQQQQSV